MDIQPTGLDAAPASVKPGGAAELSSDLDTFLTLLTAQIRNQDPLNPADSTEYASQLATFSNVEQGVRTNDLLSDLIGRIELQGLGDLASWIGMEARTTGITSFDGGQLALEASIPAAADAADLVVSDPAGLEIARMAIDPDRSEWTLTPLGRDGAPLPPGAYAFHVEPRSAGGTMQNVEAARYVVVQEALISDGATQLVLDGGVRVGASEISGLRPRG
ncbi:flagellar hook capping FlgD N-terminal domain-containing protein [Jannaschia aquimarina]|uniref:Basal-body rod modification protein FlgD n=1 Tax=Jannaschia aquimarina TaxID=935700 RepID=A0A0D1EDA6_9RHOB|nr:flagellar hook capping FlgD N-terminal domain-containing protein [Jannaschia aquimarina]KIT15689.1 Basal-body rod modification protein FlgD [Jannaschia aquimarina]SNT39119.1 flagellar basal-body rod modification protein FlgD [Jannaschia aquimarina]